MQIKDHTTGKYRQPDAAEEEYLVRSFGREYGYDPAKKSRFVRTAPAARPSIALVAAASSTASARTEALGEAKVA